MTQPTITVKHELNDKASLRKELIHQRKTLEENTRQQWDNQIGEYLISVVHKHQLLNSTIAVFSAIQAEPQLNNTYCQLHDVGIKLALPIVMQKNMPLQFSEWTPNDVMMKDEYNISIPVNLNLISPNVVLIPCVGFNRHGYRLGYGGGYYDRTLALHPRPLSIGIAYHQSEAHFYEEEYDIAMDMIITEKQIITFKQN